MDTQQSRSLYLRKLRSGGSVGNKSSSDKNIVKNVLLKASTGILPSISKSSKEASFLNGPSSKVSTTGNMNVKGFSPPITYSPVGSVSSLVTTRAPSSNLKHAPRRTFLASLSDATPTSVAHPDAQLYKKNWSTTKNELIAKLFKFYNAEIFENKIAADTKITWNNRMRGTAAFCYNRRSVTGDQETRTARIELSTRVIDRPERLRDTLLHEMCHIAAWLSDGVKTGHGRVWKAYAIKAHKRFPETQHASRCHSYKIEGKFTYRCVSCDYSISRQTKSINLVTKRCGHCYSQFELLVNGTNQGKTDVPKNDATGTKRVLNFPSFVKENYKKVKDADQGKKRGDIMKIISRQYAIYKSGVTPKKK